MRLLKDDDNQPIEIVGHMVDITAYVSIQNMLNISQENFRSIIESNPLGVMVISERGVVLYSNSIAQDMHKWSNQSLIIDPLQENLVDEPFQELSIVSENGINKTIRRIVAKTDWQGDPAHLVMLEDITSIRNTELELKLSNERYKTLSESARDFIYVIDMDGKLQYINKAGIVWLGATNLDDLIGKKLADFFEGEESIRINNSIIAIIKNQQPRSAIRQYTLGHIAYWLDTTIVPIFDNDGVIDSVMGISRDITLRKLAEENSARMGQILDDSLNEIYLFDADGLHFVQVNRGASKNLGYSLTELYDMTPLDIKPEISPEKFEEIIEPLRNGEEKNNKIRDCA